MKYKLAGLSAVIFVMAFSVLAEALTPGDNSRYRYHQHREARQPDEGCDCDGSELCTHLPLVMIETGGHEIPGLPVLDENMERIAYTTTEDGEAMLPAKISIVENEDRNNHPSDEPELETDTLIRIRGNSSRYFDKKNYLLRFTDENGDYDKLEVMGMDKHYEWALHGPYLDKSLMRNYMWYNIAGDMMDYAPNVRFCELILDGEYKGLYVMTETITSAKNCRLGLHEPLSSINQSSYVLRLDRGSSNPVKNIKTFANYAYRNKAQLDIKYPRASDLTPEMAANIEQDISDFEKALYSYDYDTEDYGYWNYIDVDSVVDFMVLSEFTQNYDANSLSTYYYKDIGGKYKMAVWDYNSCCDNYKQHFDYGGFDLFSGAWFDMFIKDEKFCQNVIDRYRELRQTFLNEEYLNEYMDEVVAYLGDAVDRNYQVWGYTLEMDMINPEERNPRSFEEAVDQMKNFIHERGSWLDKYIDVLKQYSHESKVKKYNH